MITYANLGQNLMRQYPKANKSKKKKAQKLKEKARKRGFK